MLASPTVEGSCLRGGSQGAEVFSLVTLSNFLSHPNKSSTYDPFFLEDMQLCNIFVLNRHFYSNASTIVSFVAGFDGEFQNLLSTNGINSGWLGSCLGRTGVDFYPHYLYPNGTYSPQLSSDSLVYSSNHPSFGMDH